MRFPTSAPLLRLQGNGKLAEKIRKGHTDEIDNEILRSLRRPEDPAIPIRPAWLPEVARDFTALGSGVCLALVSTVLVGFLCLHPLPGCWVLDRVPRQRDVSLPVVKKVFRSSSPYGGAASNLV